jgi:hypothetical protein
MHFGLKAPWQYVWVSDCVSVRVCICVALCMQSCVCVCACVCMCARAGNPESVSRQWKWRGVLRPQSGHCFISIVSSQILRFSHPPAPPPP